jgi:hypothetical protein
MCGRAKKDLGEPIRDVRRTVRLTKDEDTTIQQRAKGNGLALSCFMRAASLGQQGKPSDDREGQTYSGDRCGVLRTPQGQESACYEVWSVDDVVTSHDPTTWEPDPRYPRAVQERDYKGDQAERLKVQRIAQNPQPDLLLALTPTAVDGPPVVAANRVALGGNGRTMGLRLAYVYGTAGAYVAELKKRALIFGLRPEAVDAIPRPVLVRVVKGLDSASQPELAAASSRYNQGLTNAMDDRALAVSLSRRLSPETLGAIGAALEEHETLRAAMAAAGPVFVRRLRADGIITQQNQSAMVDGAGGLTELGKLTVEGAFLGLVAGTPERLSQAAAGTLQKVERLVPFVARVHARKNGHDLITPLQSALDLLYRARVADRPVAEFAGQGDMFSAGGHDPRVVAIASALESASSKRLAAAARAWAAAADYDPGQPLLFGEHPAPQMALETFIRKAQE